MSEPNFMTIHPIVVEKFNEKTEIPEYLLVALKEKSGDNQSH